MFEKLNETYYNLTSFNKVFEVTRDKALPVINKLEKTTGVQNTEYEKITKFYDKWQKDQHVKKFIRTLNKEPTYEKYKYKFI